MKKCQESFRISNHLRRWPQLAINSDSDSPECGNWIRLNWIKFNGHSIATSWGRLRFHFQFIVDNKFAQEQANTSGRNWTGTNRNLLISRFLSLFAFLSFFVFLTLFEMISSALVYVCDIQFIANKNHALWNLKNKRARNWTGIGPESNPNSIGIEPEFGCIYIYIYIYINLSMCLFIDGYQLPTNFAFLRFCLFVRFGFHIPVISDFNWLKAEFSVFLFLDIYIYICVCVCMYKCVCVCVCIRCIRRWMDEISLPKRNRKYFSDALATALICLIPVNLSIYKINSIEWEWTLGFLA